MNVNASPFFPSPFSRRRAGVVGGGYHHLGPFFLATCSTHTTHRDTFTLLVPSLCLRVGTFGHQQLLRCVCVCVCGTVCRAVSLYLFPSHRRLLGEKQNKRKQVKKKKKKKMGNRLSSCGPLIRKAYRHEDTPWQNSRKRDGHLLR